MNRTAIALLAATTTACAGAAGPPGTGPNTSSIALAPDTCGKIDVNPTGRKLYAFLVASYKLDKATIELEKSVYDACKRMAVELQVSTDGDTRALCKRVSDEIKNSMEVSVKTETRAVTKYTPPECTTDLEIGARIGASCEGQAQAGAGGSSFSAECQAAAEIEASLVTTCTEPRVEVVYENVTVIDDARFQRAVRAIETGMPSILRVAAKAEKVGKGVVTWVSALGGLVKEGGKLGAAIGQGGACVVAQLAAALTASVQIEARISVSVEVSGSIQGAAGTR